MSLCGALHAQQQENSKHHRAVPGDSSKRKPSDQHASRFAFHCAPPARSLEYLLTRAPKTARARAAPQEAPESEEEGAEALGLAHRWSPPPNPPSQRKKAAGSAAGRRPSGGAAGGAAAAASAGESGGGGARPPPPRCVFLKRRRRIHSRASPPGRHVLSAAHQRAGNEA